jgi:5-methylcytosine-specific restriction endonuclease McrA
MTYDFRSSYRWKKERKEFLRRCGSICGICKLPVDKRLSGNHRMGPTVDHVVAVIDNPLGMWSWGNWQLAHRHCNERKEHETRARIRREARMGRSEGPQRQPEYTEPDVIFISNPSREW